MNLTEQRWEMAAGDCTRGTAFPCAPGIGKYCVLLGENELSAVNYWLEMLRGVSIR